MINTSSSREVQRYNVLVHDYNDRCGSFQYRKGDLSKGRSITEKDPDISSEATSDYYRKVYYLNGALIPLPDER